MVWRDSFTAPELRRVWSHQSNPEENTYSLSGNQGAGRMECRCGLQVANAQSRAMVPFPCFIFRFSDCTSILHQVRCPESHRSCTVTKYLRQSTSKEENFILAPSFRGFSSRSVNTLPWVCSEADARGRKSRAKAARLIVDWK